MKFKIITGFREDQYFTINANEAHKAYYLFTHPEERTVFSNGMAIIGKNIQGIEPDYNATMGWNPTHHLDAYDWIEIKQKGIDRQLGDCMIKAKEVATIADQNPKVLNKPLEDIKLLE